jgi:hypothetical protein
MSGLFPWLYGEKKPDVPNIIDVPTPPEGNIAASDAANSAIEASRSSRKRRGRPAKTDTDSSGTSDIRTASPDLRAEMSRQLEAAYDPKAWGALLAAPGDAALAITGRKHWDISKDERETLGACGSVAARFLMIEHPKTLALLMLSSALFSVYVPRLAEEVKFRKAKMVNPEKKSDV